MILNLATYKLAIFDMDGLLLDTEKIAFDAFKEASKPYRIQPKIREYSNFIGVSKKYRQTLLDKFFPELNGEDFISTWMYIYQKKLKQEPIPVKKDVFKLLNTLKRNNILTAVATSTEKELAYFKLQKAGLNNQFSKIIGGDEVQRSKPDPDIYIKVQKYFGFKASECLVFEDSINGVRAAYSANMDVIQIIDMIHPNEETKSKALQIIYSIDELYN